eukprot:3736598-Rhodomonas_salina.2
MAIIAMFSRWKLGEFQPRLEDESHPDIITDTIHALHARSGADTLIVWVHAHAGDPGNEQADYQGKLGIIIIIVVVYSCELAPSRRARVEPGTASDDSEWAVITSPMAFHSTPRAHSLPPSFTKPSGERQWSDPLAHTCEQYTRSQTHH